MSMDGRRREVSIAAKPSVHSSKSYSDLWYRDSQLTRYTEPPRLADYSRHSFGAPPPLRSKSSSSWSLSNPDTRRRQRIASYKMYTAQGKVKSSFSRSFRWIKNKYIELRYGLL